MAGAKKQLERQQAAPRTPKTPKQSARKVIGSSSTWKQEELDRFKVQCGIETDPKLIIPEKWFDFGNLEGYYFGYYSRKVGF